MFTRKILTGFAIAVTASMLGSVAFAQSAGEGEYKNAGAV